MFSVPATKTGSSWLDRLRTVKGSSDDGVMDLESFLQSPNSQNPERSYPNKCSNPIFVPNQNEDDQLCNVMSNVLNELFCFGDNRSSLMKFKKSARKQVNPRICAFSSNGIDENNVVCENANGDNNNSGVERVKDLDKRDNEGEDDVNLSGFSRTEVTVIDTSYELWKFDKLLYRKKNVWKVRDKKGKTEIMRRKKKKKKKALEAMEEDPCRGEKRKFFEKDVCGVESELPLNEGYHNPRDKLEGCEKAPDKVNNKLLKKKQVVDLRLDSGSSSTILMKCITPTMKINRNKKHFQKPSEATQNKP